MLTWLPEESDWEAEPAPFPPTARALQAPAGLEGLLCAGGGLSVARLKLAYRQGIFPWSSDGEPLLWWSTAPRMVLSTAEFRLHRSLRKTLLRFLATPDCEIRFDSAFDRVIAACAGTPREGQDGTWILPRLQAAYRRWHAVGQVHSVETWVGGQLVGGLYGVNLGRMFYGESMFAHRTDASKLALCALVAFCRAEGIDWIDCQQQTGHLASLGARPVTRDAFERHLTRVVDLTPPRAWTYDPAHWSLLLPEAAAAARAPIDIPQPPPTADGSSA